MKRGTPLRRLTPLRRHVAVRRVNPARLRKRREVQFARQSELARRLPCFTCGAPPPSDPSHIKSRGADGKDDAVIPQCRPCHRAFHSEGRFSFFTKRGLDPEVLLNRMRALVALGVR